MSRAADALRRAGYHRLPPFWVTKEQLDLIIWMAKQNFADVKRIKEEINGPTLIRYEDDDV